MTTRQPIPQALRGVAASEVNRYLRTTRDWAPHDCVPWSRGRAYPAMSETGEAWHPHQSTVSPPGGVALAVNQLTEDNLPSYHHEIATNFGGDSASGTWVHRWAAEEGRHSIAIHAGARSGDPDCERLPVRIAADENLHMVFYRNVLAAAFAVDPDASMRTLRDVVASFRTPGHGMLGFERAAAQLASGEVYNRPNSCWARAQARRLGEKPAVRKARRRSGELP
jgi:acyl-[acyl-carrier-protein] desaturase